MRTHRRRRQKCDTTHQCELAQAWDEGRAAALLEARNAMNDLYGPSGDPTPNPYRIQQEIAAMDFEDFESD